MARRRVVKKQKPQKRSGQGTQQEPPKRKTNYLKPVLGGLALTGAIVAAIANRDKFKDINLSSFGPDFSSTDLFGVAESTHTTDLGQLPPPPSSWLSPDLDQLPPPPSSWLSPTSTRAATPLIDFSQLPPPSSTLYTPVSTRAATPNVDLDQLPAPPSSWLSQTISRVASPAVDFRKLISGALGDRRRRQMQSDSEDSEDDDTDIIFDQVSTRAASPVVDFRQQTELISEMASNPIQDVNLVRVQPTSILGSITAFDKKKLKKAVTQEYEKEGQKMQRLLLEKLTTFQDAGQVRVKKGYENRNEDIGDPDDSDWDQD